MFKLALVVLLCSQAYARPNNQIQPYIVGGIPATEGQFPFIVSLRDHHNLFFCGGALISDRYVVTAAHCVKSVTPKKIGAGSVEISNQKLFDVSYVTIHPTYLTAAKECDIALIRLKTAITISGNIQTIDFPVTEKLERKNVTALGWGCTSEEGKPSSKLFYLNGPIIKNRECTLRLDEKIEDTQICMGNVEGHGMCFGDSGSPLVYKPADGKIYLAGIASWGVPCAKGYPDVFTRVSYFADWIKQNMV